MIARLLGPFLAFCFVVASAFIAADIVTTLAQGALQTPPAFAVPRAVVKKRVPPPPSAITPASALPAPLTTPPLKLVGTATGAYPHAVLLSLGAKEQKLYRLRDDVGGGWILDEIRTNRVVLRNGARKEVLEVKYVETEAPTPPAVGPAAAPKPGIRLDPRDVEGALADLNKVVTQARVVPNLVGGQVAGFTIFDIVPGSIYTKLGLQNNDVVERINGVEIKTPEALYQLFQQVRTQRSIALDFRRNGKRETAQIEIR